jgi:ABC-type transport system involved in multi-copper enzyme maturation permease subunit
VSPGLAGRLARTGGGLRAVLERDFLVLTSSLRFVVFRTLLVAAVAALAFTILVSSQTFDRSTRPDEIGRAIFGGFFVAYPLLVVLIAPSLGAGCIAGERSLDTLPIVLAAPVSPFGFVLAKFLSRLGALLVPLLGGLPVAGLCFLYGGISASLFLEWMALVLGLAVMGTAASVLASAYARSVGTAVLASYFLTVVLPALETWGAMYLCDEAGLPDDSLLASHTPGYAIVQVGGAVFGRGVLAGSLVPYLATTAVATLAALLLAAGRVAREASAMAAAGPRSGSIRRKVFENPVLDRATLALPFRRGGWRAWVSLLVVAGLTWLVPLVDFDDEEILVGLNFCTWTTFFVVLARASQSLSVERQQGSLAVLLATRLGAGEVARGKLMGLGAQACVLLLPGVALAVAGALANEISPGCLATWLAATLAILTFFGALGLRVSAAAPTAGRAAAAGFTQALGGMVVHGVVLLLFALVVARHADESVMIPLASASPPVVVAWITAAPDQSSFSRDERAWLAWSVFWLVVYAAAAALLVRSTVRRLQAGE